jgi:hypothetical protein
MDVFQQLMNGPLFADSVTALDVLLHLLMSFVLAQLVAWVYQWTHHGLSYSRSQVQALVLLSLIVTVVMLAVGNNLARAFGLFGALALVRFRTPVKDARDTVFLFMSVGIGICVGSRNLALATIATAFMCFIAVYLTKTRFGERMDHDCVLRFAMPALEEQDGQLRRILSHYCKGFALVHLRETGREDTMEFSYQVKLLDPRSTPGLLGDLRQIDGLTGVNLLMQNEDLEV